MKNTAKTRNYDHNFTLMIIGLVISLFGSAILRFALDLYVLDTTGRADIFATVMAISVVPTVICSPLGGAIADRVNRRNLMVIFDFTSSALVLIIIGLYLTNHLTVPIIAIMVTLLSVISAMYQPAVQASIPVLVKPEGLVQANGIVNGVSALSGILGPVIGGSLYGLFGLKHLLIISSIAFFLSAVMEIFIQIPFTRQERTKAMLPTIFGDIKEGLQYITTKNKRLFRTILLAPAINLVLTSFLLVSTPYILRVTFESSDTMYGVGMALPQMAMIIGALIVGPIASKMRLETLHRWLYGVAALLLPMTCAVVPAFLNLGYWPSFILYFIAAMAIMMVAAILSIYLISEVQKGTPHEMLGKIMATVLAISQCATPLGQILYGTALQLFKGKTYITILIAALLTALVSILCKRLLKPSTTP